MTALKATVFLLAGLAAGLLAARFGGFPPLELEHARTAQVLAEAALVVGLYCAGLRATEPLTFAAWRVPLRLAAITLPVTAALTAGAARVLLGLPIEQALILGVVLAPTDAVAASRLELPEAGGSAQVRSTLAAEGALSSSLTLPLLLLVTGLEGAHDLGPLGARWLALDVIWALAGGALLGTLVGALCARALARLDSRGEAGWLALLCAASALVSTYGAALVLQVNGLAAAFAAGSALARGRLPWQRARAPGASRLARRLGAGADRLERALEPAAALLIGVLFAGSQVRPAPVLFALALLVAVRPLAARLGIGAGSSGKQGPRAGQPEQAGAEAERQALAWFGVRGIASLYFLSLALDATGGAGGDELVATTLAVLATSIALHGVTALPLGKRPAGAQGSR